mgnify:CR=1 FL=1
MSDELDKLLCEVQAEKEARERQQKELRQELTVDKDTKTRIAEERRAKVEGFRLNLELPEDEIAADVPADAPAAVPAEPAAPEAVPAAEPEPDSPILLTEEEEPEPVREPKRNRKKSKRVSRLAKTLFYLAFVLLFAGVLTYFGIVGIIDLLGLNKSSQTISVSIPSGSTARDIAGILKENGIIDQPLIFRLYSRLTGADSRYQPHEQLELSPDMGYGNLIDELCAEQAREEVKVTIPEGYTLNQIAALLEEKNVCTQEEFQRVLTTGDYSKYDFLTEQPDREDDPKYANRMYDLEGYLFPDTYNFFTHSSAYSAICKMLDNFAVRINADMRKAIKEKGMTLDEAVILASIIEREASNSIDMAKVSRVLSNRLNNKAEYPKLQCDSTTDYIVKLLDSKEETAVRKAYDTYICEGLPVGAICNPGLDAFNAVLKPSADQDVMKCYYFATDYKTGKTYYSRTYSQHEAVCRKYKIGMYG